MLVDTIEKVKKVSVGYVGSNGLFDSATVNAYTASLRGLSETQARVVLSSTSLDKVQKQQILNKLAETNATVSLTSAEATEALTRSLGTKEAANELLVKSGLVTKEQLLAGTTIKVTSAKIADAVATGMLTKEEGAKILTAFGLTSANIGLGTSFKLLAKSIGAAIAEMVVWLATTPAGWATLAITAIVGATAAYIKWGDTLDNTREKLADLKSECDSITSDIESVNSELETTKQRMDELEGKGTLTFTEKEEYDNLVKQNNELDRQNNLLATRLQLKNQEKNKTFVETMKKDIDYIGEYHRVGKTNLQGGATGEYWDEIFEGYSNDSRNKNISERDYINQQFKDYLNGLDEIAKLNEKYKDDLANGQYQKDKKRIEDNNAKILKYLQEKQDSLITDTDGIEYIKTPTEEYEKEVNKYLDFVNDFQDKLAIALGGNNAKTDAFNRVIDNWQFDEVVQKLQDLGKEGKVTAEMLDDPIYDTFIQKLVDLGVIDSASALDEVALAFNNFGKEITNAGGGIETASTSLAKLSEASKGLSTLKSAFDEIASGGSVTYDTLESLRQATGLSDAEFEKYATGLQQAEAGTESFNSLLSELTMLIINNKLETEGLAGVTQEELAALLQEKGVIDAEIVSLQLLTQAKLNQKNAGLNLGQVTAQGIADNQAYINTLIAEAKEAGATEQALTKLGAVQLLLAQASEAYQKAENAKAGGNDDEYNAWISEAQSKYRAIESILGVPIDIPINIDFSGADEAVSRIDAIAGMSGKIKAVADAFNEVSTNGYLTISTISSLKTATGLSGAEWDNYYNSLINSKAGSSQLNATLTNLVGTIITNELGTKALTEATEAEIETVLRENGVQQAAKVAHAAVTLAKYNELVASKSLSGGLTDEINSLFNEIVALGLSESALGRVKAQKELLNGVKIDTSTDVQELIELANAAGAAEGYLGNLALAMQKVNKANELYEKAKTTTDRRSRAGLIGEANSLMEEANRLANTGIEFKPLTLEDVMGKNPIVITPTGGGSGGGNGSTTKDEKEFKYGKNYYEEKLELIEENIADAGDDLGVLTTQRDDANKLLNDTWYVLKEAIPEWKDKSPSDLTPEDKARAKDYLDGLVDAGYKGTIAGISPEDASEVISPMIDFVDKAVGVVEKADEAIENAGKTSLKTNGQYNSLDDAQLEDYREYFDKNLDNSENLNLMSQQMSKDINNMAYGVNSIIAKYATKENGLYGKTWDTLTNVDKKVLKTIISEAIESGNSVSLANPEYDASFDLSYLENGLDNLENYTSLQNDALNQIAENSKGVAGEEEFYNNFDAQMDDIKAEVENGQQTEPELLAALGKMESLLNQEIMPQMIDLALTVNVDLSGRTFDSLSEVEKEDIRYKLEKSGNTEGAQYWTKLINQGDSAQSFIKDTNSKIATARSSGGGGGGGGHKNAADEAAKEKLEDFDKRESKIQEKLDEEYEKPIYDKGAIETLVADLESLDKERKDYLDELDVSKLEEDTQEKVAEMLEEPFESSDEAKKKLFNYDVGIELDKFNETNDDYEKMLEDVYKSHIYDPDEAKRILGLLEDNQNAKINYLKSIIDDEKIDKSTYETAKDEIKDSDDYLEGVNEESFNFAVDERIKEFDQESERINKELKKIHEAYDYDSEAAQKLVSDYRTNEKNRADYIRAVIDNDLLEKSKYEDFEDVLENSDDDIRYFERDEFNYGVNEFLNNYNETAEKLSESMDEALSEDGFNLQDAKDLAKKHEENEAAKVAYLKTVLENELLDKETREAVLDALEESEKSSKEIKKKVEEGINNQINYLFSQYEDHVEKETDELEKQADAYDILIDKSEALIEAESKMNQVQSNIRNAQREISKELAISKSLSEWLDEDNRAGLFNDTDYRNLSSKLSTISNEVGKINKWYNEEINSLTEDTWYLESAITEEYERRLSSVEQEYEIAKKTVDLEKKRIELDNILREKNIRMLMKGEDGEYKWEYVHDYEKASEVIGEAADLQSEIADMREDAEKEAILNKKRAEMNALQSEQEAINLRIKKINEETEKMRKVIEDITDPLKDFGGIIVRLNGLVGGSLDDGFKDIGNLSDNLAVPPKVDNTKETAKKPFFTTGDATTDNLITSSIASRIIKNFDMPIFTLPSGLPVTNPISNSVTNNSKSENVTFTGDIIVKEAVDNAEMLVSQLRAFRHNGYKKI